MTYTLGVPDEEPPSRPSRARLPRISAAEPFALCGCVLTPDHAIESGYIVVEGTRIAAVGEGAPPSGIRPWNTDGVILPGLIDLHGHPEYNVFAAWEPPHLYANRYQWRRSEEYGALVRDPWQKLAADPPLVATLTRYAEVRALVGGVTAIQGASAKYPDKAEALVRNVDLRIFGEHHARSMIDLSRSSPDDNRRLRQHIDQGDVNAFYVHLAEGTDPASQHELDDLAAAGLLTPATVIIHGTALTEKQLGDIRDAGAKLVWSPQSNLRLYGTTTNAAAALKLGLPVGLGADWQPSGSPSLLAELKVARRVLARQGIAIEPHALVGMATVGAAAIAGLKEHLGSLEAGRPADVLVLERRLPDPWENVVQAEPAWVELVTIDGDLAYGRADWVRALGNSARVGDAEAILAWGKEMLLDTGYAVQPGSPPLRLRDLRAALIARYAAVGPIFA